MKAQDYQSCIFKAATNAGPFRVEGHFLLHEGLAVVLHRGYGASKASPLLHVSEYATGIELGAALRSQVLGLVSGQLKEVGGAKSYLEKLRRALRDHNETTLHFRGVDTLNSALLPSGYLLS